MLALGAVETAPDSELEATFNPYSALLLCV